MSLSDSSSTAVLSVFIVVMDMVCLALFVHFINTLNILNLNNVFFLHFSQVKEIIVLLNTRFMSLTRAEMSENNENESWVDMSWVFHDRG